MTIENAATDRIRSLIEEAKQLKEGNEHKQVRSSDQRYRCTGWITAAANLVQQVVPDSSNAYRTMAEGFLKNTGGYATNQSVGEFSTILENLAKDIELGLLTSIGDRARAETFDNFLDHAKEYLKEGKAKQSGVIAGVVFEDSIRRICLKYQIDEADRNLEDLNNDLKRDNHITQNKAKRAKAAAGVRTKATHAQWEEFDLSDVQAAIDFTEDLIANHLDS